jgi:DNA-3-methyladenine glycosylase II
MLEVETVRRTGRLELDPLGPYSISASVRFLEGFAPAQYEGTGPERLRFAFVADGMDHG